MSEIKLGRKRIDFSNNPKAVEVFKLCNEGIISKREAARLLNISPMTVVRRIKEYKKVITS